MIFSCKHDVETINGISVDDPCHPSVVSFEQDVKPILARSCAISECHDAASAEDDIIYDTYENTIATGKVNGNLNPRLSHFYRSIITKTGEMAMPPKPYDRLSQTEINTLYKWVDQGALNLACKEPCDSVDVTFSQIIFPMVSTYCNGCHNTLAPLLTDYNAIKTSVDDGSFYGSITATGYSIMPTAGPLEDCQIRQIKNWIDAGSLNN